MDLDAIEEDTFPNAEPEVEDASKEQRTTQLRPSLLTTVSELIAQFDEKYPKTPAPSALHPFSPEPPDTDILESVLHASGIIATTLAGHIPSSDERYESRSLEYVNHADAWLQVSIPPHLFAVGRDGGKIPFPAAPNPSPSHLSAHPSNKAPLRSRSPSGQVFASSLDFQANRRLHERSWNGRFHRVRTRWSHHAHMRWKDPSRRHRAPSGGVEYPTIRRATSCYSHGNCTANFTEDYSSVYKRLGVFCCDGRQCSPPFLRTPSS